MTMSPITSRPRHGRLAPHQCAKRHIVITHGAGLAAFEEAFGGHRESLRSTTLIHVCAPQQAGQLERLGVDALHLAPTRETGLVKLRAVLSGADMGARLYIAGEEDFIGQAQAVALAAGMLGQAIFTEHRGSPARLVQCVHCKGFTDDVMESPVICRHCGTHLLVRDHYSRRLGAFMGVVIDAETPGLVPPAEALPPVPQSCAEARS
ncbi:dimethylamine monooxygenase subunit DmmA family protein [Xanthobacter sp. TB0136]|uniref:dimethylamine monooxygenase subunit DmmA family protein n=1 Tax=Xanthobacter sp. TB0136 TaxID=3459177 RepID=UPI004039F133